jgi:hypothetical protein
MQSHTDKCTLAPVKSILVAIICIAMIAWAGFDYWRVSQLYLSASARSPAYPENTLDTSAGLTLFSNRWRLPNSQRLPSPRTMPRHCTACGIELLHFSPEPGGEKVITSAEMLGLEDEAALPRALPRGLPRRLRALDVGLSARRSSLTCRRVSPAAALAV